MLKAVRVPKAHVSSVGELSTRFQIHFQAGTEIKLMDWEQPRVFQAARQNVSLPRDHLVKPFISQM